MTLARIVMRKIQQRLRARGFNTRTYAVCGVNELGIQLARNIESCPGNRPAAGRLLRRSAGRTHRRLAGRIRQPHRRPRRAGPPGPARHGRHRLHHVPDAGRGSHPRAARAARRQRGVGLHRARLLRVRVAARPLVERRRPADRERVRESALRRRRPVEADGRPGARLAAAGGGGHADADHFDPGQALVARPGVLPPEAVRAGRPRDSGLEVPLDEVLRQRLGREAGHAGRRPRSRRSAACCGGLRSTSCRNCST